MLSVYSFTGAAILASTIFSLLLFLSIDDNPLMKWLFGALAIIFEAGKFYAWYEYGERKAHRNFSGAASALCFYLVLAAISIGGSIGGINSATNTAKSHVAIEQAKVDAYNRQIAAIDDQITLNNQAAEKYIQMERIATGVQRIQEQNKKLRQEQQRLAMERDNLPPVAQGSVLGLIDSLAKAFHVSAPDAQLGLVVFLSVLLDFFAAFFVGVIGEENRFRHYYRRFGAFTIDAYAEPVPAGFLTDQREDTLGEMTTADVSNEEAPAEPPKTLAEKVMEALSSESIPCTKRAVAKHFSVPAEEVDSLFSDFMERGYLGKKANNHYHWVGETA